MGRQRHIASLLLLAAVGCGGAASTAAPAADADAAPEPVRERASFAAQTGGMNHEAVERTFNGLQREVQKCLERGMDRLDALGGSFTISLRIKLDGSVRSSYLSDSTLGDRATERCVLNVAESASWPKPKSGEGEAKHTFTFDGMVDVHTWDGRRMRSAMQTIMEKVHKCVSGVKGRFTATVYVRSDGRVMSAGVAPPNAAAEDQSDCVVDVLETFNFGRQPRRVSKVTFPLGW